MGLAAVIVTLVVLIVGVSNLVTWKTAYESGQEAGAAYGKQCAWKYWDGFYRNQFSDWKSEYAAKVCAAVAEVTYDATVGGAATTEVTNRERE